MQEIEAAAVMDIDPAFQPVIGLVQAHLAQGEVAAGDTIEPIERVDEGLTVADVVRLYTVDAKNQELLRRATQTSRLPDSWKDYFRKRLWDPDA